MVKWLTMQKAEIQTRCSSRLQQIAERVCWWQSAEETLRNPLRFACHVMTHGLWNDVLVARKELGDELFKRALRTASAGVLDARSWNYWHLVFGLTPVPPMPSRKLD
jgi:hypothetical protein